MKQTRNHKQIYQFKNDTILCTDVSTIKDIVDRRKLNRKELYELVDGDIKITTKGWYVK